MKHSEFLEKYRNINCLLILLNNFDISLLENIHYNLFNDCEDGEIAVILVNGEEATIKRIKKSPEGLILVPNNPLFPPMFYSNEQITNLPVSIIGKVVEMRRKL